MLYTASLHDAGRRLAAAAVVVHWMEVIVMALLRRVWVSFYKEGGVRLSPYGAWGAYSNSARNLPVLTFFTKKKVSHGNRADHK